MSLLSWLSPRSSASHRSRLGRATLAVTALFVALAPLACKTKVPDASGVLDDAELGDQDMTPLLQRYPTAGSFLPGLAAQLANASDAEVERILGQPMPDLPTRYVVKIIERAAEEYTSAAAPEAAKNEAGAATTNLWHVEELLRKAFQFKGVLQNAGNNFAELVTLIYLHDVWKTDNAKIKGSTGVRALLQTNEKVRAAFDDPQRAGGAGVLLHGEASKDFATLVVSDPTNRGTTVVDSDVIKAALDAGEMTPAERLRLKLDPHNDGSGLDLTFWAKNRAALGLSADTPIVTVNGRPIGPESEALGVLDRSVQPSFNYDKDIRKFVGGSPKIVFFYAAILGKPLGQSLTSGVVENMFGNLGTAKDRSEALTGTVWQLVAYGQRNADLAPITNAAIAEYYGEVLIFRQRCDFTQDEGRTAVVYGVDANGAVDRSKVLVKITQQPGQPAIQAVNAFYDAIAPHIDELKSWAQRTIPVVDPEFAAGRSAPRLLVEEAARFLGRTRGAGETGIVEQLRDDTGRRRVVQSFLEDQGVSRRARYTEGHLALEPGRRFEPLEGGPNNRVRKTRGGTTPPEVVEAIRARRPTGRR
jgi:hypothetical protein